MVLDLSFGKRVYDWLGGHPRVYRLIRWVAAMGHEEDLQRRALTGLGLKEGDTVLDLACGRGRTCPRSSAPWALPGGSSRSITATGC